MAKKFASHADVEEKTISFDKLSDHAYAYTAEGDPNTGIVVRNGALLEVGASLGIVVHFQPRSVDSVRARGELAGQRGLAALPRPKQRRDRRSAQCGLDPAQGAESDEVWHALTIP